MIIQYFSSQIFPLRCDYIFVVFFKFLEPINIFHGVQKSDYEPIRLSYQRASHYNSITNPFNPSVGVGLGLPSYVLPGELERRQVNEAVRHSEEVLIEQV